MGEKTMNDGIDGAHTHHVSGETGKWRERVPVETGVCVHRKLGVQLITIME